MLREFVLHLRAQEPLVVTDGSSEGMGHHILNYIPGSMLLGAFASVWREVHRIKRGEKADADPQFRSLFLTGEVSWGNAVPYCLNQAALPVPLCYQYLKNYDSLPKAEGDTAWLRKAAGRCRTINLLETEPGKGLKDQLPSEWNIPDHEAVKLKKFDGQYMTEGAVLVAQEQIFTMHAAIGPNRAAAESQLFGFSAIAEGSEFEASVLCEENTAVALRELLAKSDVHNIRVGHARSAGYGSCIFSLVSEQEACDEQIKTDIFTLYLKSGYTPRSCWEGGLDGLRHELAQTLGIAEGDLQVEKMFCSFEQVQGFNSLWRMPRREREVIRAGSVLKIKAPGCAGKSLGCCLGGSVSEGYGRIMVDPKFLGSLAVIPQIPDSVQSGADGKSTGGAPDERQVPLLRIIKNRAIETAAQRAALKFVNSEEISALIEDAGKNSKPGASQRGNLRMMITQQDDPEKWYSWFKEMLNKTPGDQWKNADARFKAFGHRKESLADIMQVLLADRPHEKSEGNSGRTDFKAKGQPEPRKETIPCFRDLTQVAPEIPLGTLNEEDLKRFRRRYHKLALLELINAWDKACRRQEYN